MNPKRVQWAVIGVLTGRNDNWGAEEEPAPNRKIMCRFGCRLLSLNDVHTGLSSVRGLPSQALTAASSPPRRRLAGVSTRSSHCQDPAGLTALLVNRSEVLLCTRRAHKPCSHGALIHGVRTTQRLTVAAAPASSLLLSPDSFRPDHRACLGRGRKGAGLPLRPRLNCEVRGQLLPLGLRQARRVGRVWCAVLASHPLRRALSTDPAHTQCAHAACTAHNPRAGPRRASCLVGAAPSRRPMPKLTMPGRRCHRRRELPFCLLPV